MAELKSTLEEIEYWRSLEKYAREQKDIFAIINAIKEEKSRVEHALGNDEFNRLPLSRTGIATFLKFFNLDSCLPIIVRYLFCTVFHEFINIGNQQLLELTFIAKEAYLDSSDLYTTDLYTSAEDRPVIKLCGSSMDKIMRLGEVKFCLDRIDIHHGDFFIGIPDTKHFLLRNVDTWECIVDYENCGLTAPYLCLNNHKTSEILRESVSIEEMEQKAYDRITNRFGSMDPQKTLGTRPGA